MRRGKGTASGGSSDLVVELEGLHALLGLKIGKFFRRFSYNMIMKSYFKLKEGKGEEDGGKGDRRAIR